MKKILLNAFAASSLLVLSAVPVLAAKPLWVINFQNLRDELRGTQGGNLKQRIEQLQGNFRGKAAKIIDGTVSGISGTTLTVRKDGKTYIVNTDSKTQFRRHFWGKSSFAEIGVNDHVNVYGLWTDQAPHTTILAHLIRDLSIWKRRGAFFGNITTVTSGNSFTMQTLGHGVLTVTISPTSKLVNRKEQSINFSDLAVGQRVRVKGLWDKTLKTITEVTQVKDFSLPPQPSPTPTP